MEQLPIGSCDAYYHLRSLLLPKTASSPVMAAATRYHVIPARRICSQKLLTISSAAVPPMCSPRPLLAFSPPSNPTTAAASTATTAGILKITGSIPNSIPSVRASLVAALAGAFMSLVAGVGVAASVAEPFDGDGRRRAGVQYSSLLLYFGDVRRLAGCGAPPARRLAAASCSLLVLGVSVGLPGSSTRSRRASGLVPEAAWVCLNHRLEMDLIHSRAEALACLCFFDPCLKVFWSNCKFTVGQDGALLRQYRSNKIV